MNEPIEIIYTCQYGVPMVPYALEAEAARLGMSVPDLCLYFELFGIPIDIYFHLTR